MSTTDRAPLHGLAGIVELEEYIPTIRAAVHEVWELVAHDRQMLDDLVEYRSPAQLRQEATAPRAFADILSTEADALKVGHY